MAREFTEGKTNDIDNLRYMAKDVYGTYPFLVKLTTKVVEINYSSGTDGEYQLINPIYATNVLVGRKSTNLNDDIAVSFGTTDFSDSFVQLGDDGDIFVGNIIQFIKVCGNAQSEETITLTITGYELWYNPYLKLYCDETIGIVNGTGYYNYGEEVQISALSVTGNDSTMTFDHWSDGSTERVRTIRLRENLELTAIFKERDMRGVINSGEPTFTFSLNSEKGVEQNVTVPVQENGVWFYDIPAEIKDSPNLFYSNFKNSAQNASLTEFCFGSLKVKALKKIFENCASITKIGGLLRLDTSECVNMNGFFVFTDFSHPILLDEDTIRSLENMYVGKSLSFSYFFKGVGNGGTIDLSEWVLNEEEPVEIRAMFSLSGAEKVILPSNISKITPLTNNSNKLELMFYQCKNCEEIVGLDGFTLKKIVRVDETNTIDCSGLFLGDNNLKSVSMPKMELDENISNIGSWFSSCSSLLFVRLDSIKTNQVATVTNFFRSVPNTCKVYWHSSDNSRIEGLFPNLQYVNLDDYAFYGWTAPNKTMVIGGYYDSDTDQFVEVSVTSDSNGFFGVLNSELETYAQYYEDGLEFLVNDENGSNFHPFQNDTDLKEFYFQCGFNSDNERPEVLSDWGGFFMGCTSLKRVVFSGNDYKFHDMIDFFNGCSSLNEVVLKSKIFMVNGAMSNGLEIDRMFKDCVSLKSLDLENISFKLYGIDDYLDGAENSINGIFDGCTSLEYVNMPYIYKIGNAPIQTDVFNGLPDGAVVECKRSTYDWCEGSQYENIEFVLSKDDVDGYTADEIEEGESFGMFHFTINGEDVVVPFYEGGHFRYNHFEKIDKIDFHATNLIRVVLGEGCADVTELNSYGTFQNCEQFTGIGTELPKGFGAKATGTAEYLFSGCVSLVDISFLENLDLHNMTSVLGMFYNCGNLSDISVIGKLDFSQCVNAGGMFNGCTMLSDVSALKKVDFSKCVNAGGMFSGCENLNIETMPFRTDSLQELSAMFSGCTSIRKFSFVGCDTQTYTSLGAMFSGCTALTKMDFGEGFGASVNSVVTFLQNTAIESLVIPKGSFSSLQSWGSMFSGCNALKNLKFESTMPSLTSYSGHSLTPANIEELEFCDDFGANIVSYNGNALLGGMNNLKKLVMGKNFLANQTNSSFAGFFSNTGNAQLDVVIPKGFFKNITSFGGCFSSLTCNELRIEETFENARSFGDFCYGLTAKRIILPKNFAMNLTSISGGFSNNTSAEEITIPKGFAKNYVGSAGGFLTGTYFKKITIEESFPNITDASGFASSSVMDEINFPIGFFKNAVGGSQLLVGCPNLKKVVFPKNSLQNITSTNAMFASCAKLESVEFCEGFGKNVTDANAMFYGCDKLKEVVFPDYFMSETNDQHSGFAGSSVFSGCMALKKIVFPNGFGEKFTELYDNFYINIHDSLQQNRIVDLEFRCNFPNVTTAVSAFYHTVCKKITICDDFLPICTNANYMFDSMECNEIRLGKNILANATQIKRLFHAQSQLSSIRLTKDFAPNAVDMEGLFSDSHQLENIEMEEGFGAKATNIVSCFDLTGIRTLKLPKSFGMNATTASGLFQNANQLENLTFGGAFIPKVQYTPTNCFSSTNIKKITFPKGSFGSVQETFSDVFSGSTFEEVVFDCDMNRMYNMFKNNSYIKKVVFNGNFAGRNNFDLRYTFQNCSNLESVVFNGKGTFYQADLSSSFQNCPKLKLVSMRGIVCEDSVLTSTFYGCTELGEIHIDGISGYDSDQYQSTFGSYYEDWEYEYNPETDEEEEVEVQVKEGCVKDGCVVTYARRKFTGFESHYDFINWENTSHDVTGHVSSLFLSEIRIYNKTYNEYATVKVDGNGNFSYDFPMEKTPNDFTSMFEGVQIDKVDLTNLPFVGVQNFSKMFKGCSMLTDVSVMPDFGINGTNFSEMYRGCSSIVSIKQRYGTLNDVSYMFDGCDSLRKVDMTFCNAVNVTNFNGFIPNRNNISVKCQQQLWNEGLVSTFNNVVWNFVAPTITGKTKSANQYIYVNMGGSKHPIQSDSEKNFSFLFDYEKYGSLTHLKYFLNNQSNIVEVNLENLNTDTIESLEEMIDSCSRLESVVLPVGFGKNATNANNMICYCSSLETIDLTNFDSGNVMSMQNMFKSDTKLKNVIFPDGFGRNCTNFNSMFYGCSGLVSIDLKNIDFSNANKIEDMFNFCINITTIDMAGCDTRKVTDWYSFVPNRNTLTVKCTIGKFKQDIINAFDSVNWVVSIDSDIMGIINDGAGSFSFHLNGSEDENIVTVSVDENGRWSYNIPEGISITSMKSMFSGCTNLSSVFFKDDLDTSSVLDMSSMFEDCLALSKLQLPQNFGANADNVRNMFKGSGFQTLSLPSGFAENATLVEGCFQSMTNLQYLTINGDFGKNAESFENLMYNCRKCTDARLQYVTGTSCENFTNAFAYFGYENYSYDKQIVLSRLEIQNEDTTDGMFTNVTNSVEVFMNEEKVPQEFVDYWQNQGVDIVI